MMTRASGPGPGDGPRGLDPVEHRHPHVHQHHVGRELADLADRLGAVGGLAHNPQIVLALQDQAETHPQERLVIHQQDADRSGLAHRFPLTHVPLLPLSPFQCSTACTRQP